MSEEDANAKVSTTTIESIEPETLTVNVDKTTLAKIRERMEGKYNEFWGDVIDDEQKRTIEIADQLNPGKPYTINKKQYQYNHVGMKRWRDLSKLKSRADAEKDPEIQMDLLTEYYTSILREFFNMPEAEADMVPPGDARMIGDAAAYKVLHPVPLHPEKLRSGSTSVKQ